MQTLPWTATRSSRLWPPDVEAYACLKWRQWSAPCFIAWDRAAAPAVHRRKRVSGWYTYALSHRWQTPPILVVCPSEREVEEWARAVVISADRRGCPPLTVFLATAPAAQTDPTGEIWRRAHGRAKASLFERLTKCAPREGADSTFSPSRSRPGQAASRQGASPQVGDPGRGSSRRSLWSGARGRPLSCDGRVSEKSARMDQPPHSAQAERPLSAHERSRAACRKAACWPRGQRARQAAFPARCGRTRSPPVPPDKTRSSFTRRPRWRPAASLRPLRRSRCARY